MHVKEDNSLLVSNYCFWYSVFNINSNSYYYSRLACANSSCICKLGYFCKYTVLYYIIQRIMMYNAMFIMKLMTLYILSDTAA